MVEERNQIMSLGQRPHSNRGRSWTEIRSASSPDRVSEGVEQCQGSRWTSCRTPL